MKKRWIFIFTVLFFAMTLMVGLTTLPTKALAKDKPIVVKIPTLMPKAPPSLAPTSQFIALFAKCLEKRSGGRFDVKVYWSESLYKDDETCYAALRDNVVQVAFPAGARMGGEIPELNIYSLPFSFKNFEHYRRFAHGPKGFKSLGGPGAKLFEPLFAKRGYKLISPLPVGFQEFISSKGFLENPEDFKGVKFRVRPSKLAADIAKSFGGSAQAIPYTETYTALSLKTVDAAECPLYIIQAVKWHETADYITLSRHNLLTANMIVNPTFYNGLPEDLKKIFDECAEKAIKFLYKTSIVLEQRMPWIMMSQVPSLQFKWLAEKERDALKQKVVPIIDGFKKTIPKDFWDALEATRPK